MFILILNIGKYVSVSNALIFKYINYYFIHNFSKTKDVGDLKFVLNYRNWFRFVASNCVVPSISRTYNEYTRQTISSNSSRWPVTICTNSIGWSMFFFKQTSLVVSFGVHKWIGAIDLITSRNDRCDKQWAWYQLCSQIHHLCCWPLRIKMFQVI